MAGLGFVLHRHRTLVSGRPGEKQGGNGNGNGNQRGPYACMLAPTPDQPLSHGDGGKLGGGRGNRNRNDKQLELNACMLAPTPLLTWGGSMRRMTKMHNTYPCMEINFLNHTLVNNTNTVL